MKKLFFLVVGILTLTSSCKKHKEFYVQALPVSNCLYGPAEIAPLDEGEFAEIDVRQLLKSDSVRIEWCNGSVKLNYSVARNNILVDSTQVDGGKNISHRILRRYSYPTNLSALDSLVEITITFRIEADGASGVSKMRALHDNVGYLSAEEWWEPEKKRKIKVTGNQIQAILFPSPEIALSEKRIPIEVKAEYFD